MRPLASPRLARRSARTRPEAPGVSRDWGWDYGNRPGIGDGITETVQRRFLKPSTVSPNSTRTTHCIHGVPFRSEGLAPCNPRRARRSARTRPAAPGVSREWVWGYGNRQGTLPETPHLEPNTDQDHPLKPAALHPTPHMLFQTKKQGSK